MPNELRVMQVARAVVDEINEVLDKSRPRLIHIDQIRESGGSITANIREGYGRRRGPERNQFFRFARASAEETDERLRSNFASERLPPRQYWRLHHRLALVCKMLTRLMST
jgi:four helix bundle protein